MKLQQGAAKNMELVGYHDLNGRPGFQMAMQNVGKKWYLYVAHWNHQGWTVMDVTEPTSPKFIKFVPDPGGKPGTGSIKVQVADGIMVVNLAQKSPFYSGVTADTPYDEGIYIFDVKTDPENPKFLSHWKTGAHGTHRFFWGGGRYVHLSAGAKGFNGYIYRIVDIQDPTHPVEAGRWWLPEQWEAGGAKVRTGVGMVMLHGPAYPNPELTRAYLSYAGVGMIILDISDISVPKIISTLQTTPPFGWGAPHVHTVLPLLKRKLAIITSEGRRVPAMPQGSKQTGHIPPMNFIGVADIGDEKEPTLISIFPVPRPPPGSPFKHYHTTERMGAFGFGPHNLHEPHYHPDLEDRDDRIYVTYFSAGVRVYDISDPFMPEEVAYYVPPDPKTWAFQKIGAPFPGDLRTNVEDIIVDKRGYIFVTDMQQGLHILKCTI